MVNCKYYQNLISKYLDGIIEPGELETLQLHLGECLSCQQEFRDIKRVQELIRDSYRLASQASNTKDKVLSAIEANPANKKKTVFRIHPWFAYPVAACLLLVLGAWAGFYLGQNRTLLPHAGTGTEEPAAIEIRQLEGMVLVKHQDANIWQELQPQTKIFRGDRLETMGKSRLALVLDDGSAVEMDHSSSLTLHSYNGMIEFGLQYGSVKAVLDSPHEPFFISTPQGRIEALGTEFVVIVK